MRWAAAIASALLASSCHHSVGPSDDNCSCSDGLVCRYDGCIALPTACTTNASCPGDQYCDTSAMECLPWGVGPGGTNDDSCHGDPTPGVFFPGVQCQWSGPPDGDLYPGYVNVLATPMVATFDAGGTPSIVFATTDTLTASCAADQRAAFGVIRVIDGRTCEQQATIAGPVVGSAPVAIADLVGDATPEIVAARASSVRGDGGLIAFTRTATGWDVLWETQSPFPSAPCDWAGPSIHDLDDDGVPEVIFYGAVYNGQTGATIDHNTAIVNFIDVTGLGYIPVVADVDGDGVPELVTGSALYSWDKMLRTWTLKHGLPAGAGQVAVGDFGTFPDNGQDDRSRTDGIAETVVVLDGMVHVFTVTGHEVFTAGFSAPDRRQGLGGPPILADFDGDGRLEIGSAAASAYHVFDPDCRGVPDPATCASMSTNGVLWATPSPGADGAFAGGAVASSSAFDFDGDGRAEIVHGDRCFTRVYDGRTGTVEMSHARTSCPFYDNPVIADTDGDHRAELVTTSNANIEAGTRGTVCGSICPPIDPVFDGVSCVEDTDCPSHSVNRMSCGRDQPGDAIGRCRCAQDQDCGDGFACREPIAGPSPAGKVCRASRTSAVSQGVQVLADTVDRWAAARPIWNQHAYSVTNIDDAGRVPRTSRWLRNWTQVGLNNFRQSADGNAKQSRARPDLTIRQAKVTCDVSAPTVSAEVCNRGSLEVAAGVPVTVYASTTPTRMRCQAQTTAPVMPGMCTIVSCAWLGPAGDGAVSVDDRGTGAGVARECREDNNVLPVHVSCP